MDDQVFIVAPNARLLSKIVRWNSGKTFAWTYLGQRIDEARLADRVLGEVGSRIDLSESFQSGASDLRDAYLTYVYDLARASDGLRWWLTSISYRSAYMSKTFQLASYLKAGLDLATNWQGPKLLVIVAGEPALRQALGSNLSQTKGTGLRMLGATKVSFLSQGRDLLSMLAHRAYFLCREGRRVIRAKGLASAPQRDLQGATLLISTIHARNSELGSEFHRYVFGDLARQLVETGHKLALMPLILRDVDYGRTLGSLRDSALPLVVPHQYLKLWDVLWAVLASWRKPPVPRPIPQLAEMDISPLVNEEIRTHWVRNEATDAMLIMALVRRWRTVGASFDRVIYSYENRPWERALCWQVRRSLPECELVGYQFGRIPRLLLNWHLAPGESAQAPLPDKVVTGGEYGARLLRSSGYPDGAVIVGGTLQKQDILDRQTKANPSPSAPSEPSILVATSYGREEAAELIELICQLFCAPGAISEPTPIVIKCHPLMPFSRLAEMLNGPLPEYIEVSRAPINELMSNSSLMIYTSSTACIEALALGLPVIHLCPGVELDMDPLEYAPDTRLEARDLAELRQQVGWLLEHRADYVSQHQTEWGHVVKEVYGPVTQQTYRAFVEPLVPTI